MKKKILLIVSIIFLLFKLNSQCPTINPDWAFIDDVLKDWGDGDLPEETIKICFHVWGNESIGLLDQSINNLNSYFAGTGFTFYYERCATTYHENPSETSMCYFNQIIKCEDGINVHTLGSFNIGLAESIPGKTVLVGGKREGVLTLLSSSFAHEIGHCLGLFHTHNGTSPEEYPGSCNGDPCFVTFDDSYDPNVPNSYLGYGDYVADTNPDPNTVNVTPLNACNFDVNHTENNPHSYSAKLCDGPWKQYTRPPLDFINEPPPVDNIMSYYHEGCRKSFTHRQAYRMHKLKPTFTDSEPVECSCGEETLVDGSTVSDLLNLFQNGDLATREVDVFIEGTLNVDQNISIPENVNFYLDENARINVETGISFSKTGGFIAACDKPFYTIYFDEGSKGNFEDCDISGAGLGVYFNMADSGVLQNVGIYNCNYGVFARETLALTIDNCSTNARTYGINTNGCPDLSIQNSDIGYFNSETTYVGIRTSRCSGKITNNLIRTNQNGVLCYGGNVEIGGNSTNEGNIIFNDGIDYMFPGLKTGYGIATIFNDSKTKISRNQVAVTSQGSFLDWQGGILVTRPNEETEVSFNNVISFNESGIRNYAGSDLKLLKNLIMGTANHGVISDRSISLELECNQISASTYGIYLENGATQDILTNNFEKANTDLYLSSPIGPQRLRGNYDWETVEVETGYDVQQNFFTASKEVETDVNGNITKRLIPISYPSDLFRETPDGDDEVCEGGPGRNGRRRAPVGCWYIEELMQQKSDGSEGWWSNTYEFLRYHLKDTDVNEWPIELWNSEPEMMAMLKADISFRNTVADASELLSLMKEQMQADDSPSYMALRELYNDNLVQEAQVISNEISELDNLNSTHEIFNVRKDAFVLEMKSRQQDFLDDSDVYRLKEIADLCPDIYGDVVYSAQGLILFLDIMHFPKENPCENDIDQRSRVDKINPLISITPIPASDKIVLGSEDIVKAEVVLYTSTGRSLVTEFMTGKTLTIETRAYPSGVYFVHIIRKSHRPEIHKIIIQN